MSSRWHAKTTKVTARYRQPGGASITLDPTDGDTSVGPMNAANEETIKVLNRTSHDGFVEGPDLVQDVSITLKLKREELTDLVKKTVSDFFRHKGAFAAEVGVDDTIDGSWEFLIDFDDGAGLTGQMLLPMVEGEITFAEGAESHTWSFSGRNHLEPVFS